MLQPRARFALTYRYSNRNIGQGVPHQGPIPIVVSDPVSGTITINENAGVFNAALHPTKNWDLNGTVEIGYADNAFTAVGQRQFKTYRVHTLYRPKTWATISGSFSDRERHNNTNNNQDVVCRGRCELQRPDQPRRLQPHRQRGRGAGAERALWREPQLLLQRCVRGHQHLLQQRRGSRHGHHPRVRWRSHRDQHRSTQPLRRQRDLVGQGLHGCANPVRIGVALL